MTAIQLNAELARELSLIANDETMLAKVLKSDSSHSYRLWSL